MKLALCVCGAVYEVLAVYLGNVSGDVCTAGVANHGAIGASIVIVVGVNLIERVTRKLVYTHKCIGKELVTAAALHYFVSAREYAVLILFGQRDDLVLDERGVGGEIHCPILVLIDVYIGVYLETLVLNCSQISRYRRQGLV